MASGLENIETIESPFRRFVTTIGVFPTAFTDAMTYYECLAYLVKYMEDTMIPAINENAEAVEELQGLYIQLKSYVDNYFDNLDVQEEINNKLDQMVEAGTLQEIISDYLKSKALFGFDNVADMLDSANLIDGSYARTLGFYSKNDGGGALYKIRAITNDDTVNNITLFAMDANDLVAELVIEPKLNVLQCGVKNDGSTDASTTINYLINNYNNCTIFVPNGDYLINSTIQLGTATKIEGENQFKTRFFTNSAIVMMQNKDDDIATCYVSNIYLDGNNIATKGFYLYRNRPNLVYNDSRSLVENILVKKCTDWCFQIGEPTGNSNVIEIVVNNVYVHEYTGGGVYISKCSDSHFSNIRSGSGQLSTKPAILVEGYNLQLDKIKGFLAGNSTTPYSGVVFNYGANIVAEVEAQANNKYGVEINNTKDSIFNIVADKNCSSSSYAGILINNTQNCIVNGVVSNNVTADGFNTTTACKLIAPKKLTLNLQTDVSVTKILDLSQYNTNQIASVNADINVNGYDITDVTPTLPDSVTAPSGVTITKIGNGKYHVAGTVTSDQNVWFAGSYGQHTMLTKIYDGFTYSLSTKNKDIGMSLWNYVTNLGGGRCSKIEGSTSEVTAIAITLKANVTYDCIIEPQVLACPNTWLTI